MKPCPYPKCESKIADRDEAWRWHFETLHRRKPQVHEHAPREFDRIEPCKFCPLPGTPFGFYANGCRHKDLGLAMIPHIGAFHPDKIVGYDLERDRLTRSLKGRQN